MTHYDLAIIGSGSGNSLPDERFDGKKIAILEEGTFGGTCLSQKVAVESDGSNPSFGQGSRTPRARCC